jgi:hypothetical protein
VLTTEEAEEALEEHVSPVADSLLPGEEPGHRLVQEE